MKSFEELIVWQRSKNLAVGLCREIESCKNWGIRDQLTRSLVSVPSNIAEGAERISKAEFRQFLGYAKGSAGEARTQVIIARELGYLNADFATQAESDLCEISRMIHGLIRSLDAPV